jgi:hypothetical protein
LLLRVSAHDDLGDSSGRPLDRVGSTLLGRGGEARVWSLPASGKALKILEPHARTAERLRVLEHLMTTPATRLQGVDDDLPWGAVDEGLNAPEFEDVFVFVDREARRRRSSKIAAAA